MTDDEQAQAVLEGLSGLRRCPLCHERGFSDGLMHRILLKGAIVNGVQRPSDPGWECNDCDFLMFDDEEWLERAKWKWVNRLAIKERDD